MTECRNMSYDEIELCIEGEVTIGKTYVDPGISNVGTLINGQSNEDYDNDEGLIR